MEVTSLQIRAPKKTRFLVVIVYQKNENYTKKFYRNRHKKRKIDSQIHTKLSAGPLGNQSSLEISLQDLSEKIKTPEEYKKATKRTRLMKITE